MAGSPRRPGAATHAILSTEWLARQAAAVGNDLLDVQSPMGLCVVWLGGVRPRMVRRVAVGEPLPPALPRGAQVLLARTDAAARRGCAAAGVRFIVADDGDLLDEAGQLAAAPPDSANEQAADFAELLLQCPLLKHAGDPGDDPPRSEGGDDTVARHAWLWNDDGPDGPGGPSPMEAVPEADRTAVPVLRAAPQLEGADPAELPGLRRLAALARAWPRRPAPAPAEASRVLEARFPWMPDAISVMRRELALLPPGGSAVLAPILLVGPPGSGKTSLGRALLDALGIPFRVVGVADGGGATSLAGAGRGWRSARPCLPVELMLVSGVSTVGIVMDDLDRQQGGGEHGAAAAWLLSVLEPANAARYWDAFAMVEADLRTVSWIVTANDPSLLPSALRDRCVEIHVRPPPPAMLAGVIQRMVGEVLDEAGWAAAGSEPALTRPHLPQSVVRLLVAAAGATEAPVSLRAVRRAVRAALGALRLGDDPTLAAMVELGRTAEISGSGRGPAEGRPH